jgi:DNA primase large subunit
MFRCHVAISWVVVFLIAAAANAQTPSREGTSEELLARIDKDRAAIFYLEPPKLCQARPYDLSLFPPCCR